MSDLRSASPNAVLAQGEAEAEVKLFPGPATLRNTESLNLPALLQKLLRLPGYALPLWIFLLHRV
jgi:hypothetical protein